MLSVDRRSFVAGAGSLFLSGFQSRATEAIQSHERILLSAYQDPQGAYGLALLDLEGTILHKTPLSLRGHGFAVDRARSNVVAFPRRPGNIAIAFSPSKPSKVSAFNAPAGRHFYGHGAYSIEGKLLYASENDFENAKGIIGIYDTTNNFSRLGEFSSYGIGPHEICLMPDGITLCIANGGIETHPDFSRQKLNLNSMMPTIAFIDAQTGDLIANHVLPSELNRVSLRHMTMGKNNEIWIGSQYEGSVTDEVPLIWKASMDHDLAPIEVSAEHNRSLAHYVGSICAFNEGNSIAISSPKGNTLLIVDAIDGRVLHSKTVAGVTGLANANEQIISSSVDGQIGSIKQSIKWDNHLIAL